MEDTRSSTSRRSSGVGAEYTLFAGSRVPARYGDPAAEYAALRRGAALVDLSYKPVFRLSGRDPVGMLNAILTNDVPEDGGRGAYALLLDPKGRIQTDLRVLKNGEDVLIPVEPEGAGAAKEILGRYAPFSRAKLEELGGWGILGLYGPRAKGLLGIDLDEHETAETAVAGTNLLAAGVSYPLSGLDLLGSAENLRATRDHLLENGARPAGVHAYETVRVEAGTPRFGTDITPDNFPAEAGLLDRAVNFHKGCYPGQETVARMHYRGHPNRALHRLKVEGIAPPPDTPILQGEKQVGKITSVAPLPVDGQILALGYLHRKADTDAPLQAGEARVSPLHET